MSTTNKSNKWNRRIQTR